MPRYQRLSERRKAGRKRARHRAEEAAQKAAPLRSRKPSRLTKRRHLARPAVISGMRYDSRFGRIYTSAPAIVDDLTKVHGIDADAQQHLQALGLYKLEQLRRLTPQQIQAVQAQGIPLEEDHLWQRWQADIRGESYPAATEDAPSSTSLPAQPLHHLTGISPSLEAALVKLGIQRFFQIALWDSATRVQFAQRLGLPSDQIQKQRWVEQARSKG